MSGFSRLRVLLERGHLEELVSTASYRDLFERLPIAVWEEDFSPVGSWLESLREAGVEDLRGYLGEHPEEIDHGVGLIKLLDANQAAVELVGADTKGQILGGSLQANLTEESRQPFVEQFVAIWEGRDRIEIELIGSTLNGERIHGMLHGSMRSFAGRLDLSRVLVAIIDTTKRKAAEEQLKELVQSKDELIASVSHEIRTPLTAVLGLAQLLRDDQVAVSEDEREEMLQTLVEQSVNIANIVDDCTVAAKAEIGELRVMHVPVDLRAQAAQVLETWDRTTIGRIQLSGPPIRCLGDPVRIRQIIRNLVSNALRHGGGAVRVVVGSDRSSGYVRVVDDGPGIPEGDRERLFESPQSGARLPGLTSALGLGLGISRHLARLMHGDLTYRHNQGESLLRLNLPLARPNETPEHTHKRNPPAPT